MLRLLVPEWVRTGKKQALSTPFDGVIPLYVAYFRPMLYLRGGVESRLSPRLSVCSMIALQDRAFKDRCLGFADVSFFLYCLSLLGDYLPPGFSIWSGIPFGYFTALNITIKPSFITATMPQCHPPHPFYLFNTRQSQSTLYATIISPTTPSPLT